MTGPRRMLEQDATDAERALLHSAQADGPPAGAAQRMMLALEGLTAVGGGPTASGPGQALGGTTSAMPVAVQAVKLGALAKVGLAALIGAGTLGGGLLVHGLTSRRAVSVEGSGAGAPMLQAAPAPGPAENPSATAGPLPATASATRQPAPADPGMVSRRLPVNESLSAELRILDTARAAVEVRDPAAAQRALESYARRFPQGHLKPEATVLRLAVLVQHGDHAAAKSLAAQLLASETYKAYEPRIRSWLREAEN